MATKLFLDGPISRKRELLSLPGSTVVHMRPTSPTSLLNSLLLLNAFAFVFVFLHSLTSLFEKVALQRPPSFASFLDSLFFVFRSLPQLHRAPQELPLRDHSYRRPINLSPFSILHRENICSSHSKRPLCTSKPLTQLLPGPKAYWKYFRTLAYNTSPQLERQEPFHHTKGFASSV